MQLQITSFSKENFAELPITGQTPGSLDRNPVFRPQKIDHLCLCFDQFGDQFESLFIISTFAVLQFFDCCDGNINNIMTNKRTIRTGEYVVHAKMWASLLLPSYPRRLIRGSVMLRPGIHTYQTGVDSPIVSEVLPHPQVSYRSFFVTFLLSPSYCYDVIPFLSKRLDGVVNRCQMQNIPWKQGILPVSVKLPLMRCKKIHTLHGREGRERDAILKLLSKNRWHSNIILIHGRTVTNPSIYQKRIVPCRILLSTRSQSQGLVLILIVE